ncbi:hypothetical protein XOC_3423 [Xanthomonas oryzae pv. oryzicola BLS256]|uniref:Uncharacterized protein n=1 Tax=Xanthomonas oryzae pv. oryzicola (strain BLS256) TaxID=383407 RepID=G7TDI9_XANOB|nr:hypothetical protein XOC_3423 [Xanthomonas oryzae pv. oryzicola BLS256]QEO96343.1 hypothetical protein XOCgx_1350 [Xanthomonas oryzae pv. oryzicola]
MGKGLEHAQRTAEGKRVPIIAAPAGGPPQAAPARRRRP